ncbi:UTRA domain-containing protein [Paludibacterium yongneupense]|uniref:UTRA domain-containing protein n=1 Tax=Paludibacterium yongneupense TaxID=400061 RepID=UPI0004185FD6|nr:UTRA domain-containing protein [Paludibacterium yongneupense]
MERTTTQTAQIRLALTSQINSGLLQSGMKLPSERELSELFGTTRITIKEALQSLEAEGRIYCEDRRGWFVAPPRLVYNPLYRSHFHEMVERQQRQASTRVLSVRNIVAAPSLCQELELPALSRLFQIRRVRSLDGRVVMFVEHHLKPERFPGILELDLSQSLTGIYQQHYDIHYGRSRFDIVSTAASGEVAQALTLGEGSPILLVSRVNYDQHGAIIDSDHEYWRHDAVRISVDSRPG